MSNGLVDGPPVEALDVTAYTVPTDSPEADGTLSWSSTTVVVVEPVAGGQRGLGWSYTGAGAVDVVTDLLAEVVLGTSALDPPAASTAMIRAVRNVGRPGVASCAISAVDIGLWDLKAKLLGLPLASLLGQVRDQVPVYGSGGFTTYDDDQTRAQLAHWVKDLAIPRVKIKIGESWGSAVERDLARVTLARETVGPSVELYVDANGGYSVGQAVRVGHRLDELGVSWFEEPVSSDDLAGLAQVRHALATDVAAGEYGYDLTYFQRMAGAGAVDCLQVDITRCGGVTEFLRAAAVAAAHHLDVSAHCAPHLHAPVVAALPNLRHVEYFHDHVRIEEELLFAGARPAAGGVLTPVADLPGLGMTVKQEEAERFCIRAEHRGRTAA